MAKKRKPEPPYSDEIHKESDLPREEYTWLKQQDPSSGEHDNKEGMPPGLKDMSQTDAVSSWIIGNCHFAQVRDVTAGI